MKLRNKKTGREFNVAFHADYKDGKIFIGVEAEPDPVYPKCNFSNYESLKEFCENWEDSKLDIPKRYRLLKDLPTFKEGDEFFTDENGSLWLEQNICEQPNTSRVMAYNSRTIDKFPNILDEWFEEIKPAEPLIEDTEIRKAVRAWADAIGEEKVKIRSDYCLESEEDDDVAIIFTSPFFEDFNRDVQYTIAELCGEKEE